METLANDERLGKALKVIKKLQQELNDSQQAGRSEPVAIVGVGCRFPGASSVDEFWHHLIEGHDLVGRVPLERWNIQALQAEQNACENPLTFPPHGGFLSNIDLFDHAFFNISPREARQMDPQQRLLLETSWHAFESAGINPEQLCGSSTAVVVGVSGSDYARLALQDQDNIDAYLLLGNATSVVAGRLSFYYGFTGPCLALDTACSSGLVAVHTACESIRRNECEVALACTVNLMLAPEVTSAFDTGSMLAPDGRCKSFDNAANGYVRSEGAAVLILKKLSAALRDGDNIQAVIRGTHINQDGASGGITVPNGPSQSRLIAAAIAKSGLKPEQISYVETHGTGTPLGDPIEVGALGDVFVQSHSRNRPLLIGSVKSHCGHLEHTAGMVGLIKVMQAFRHQMIPGNLHFQEPSRHIPWAEYPLEVVARNRPWPTTEGKRIAGVSSFGFSGTNAHIILEESPTQKSVEIATGNQDKPQLFCVSAKSEQALLVLLRRYQQWLQSDAASHSLEDICWSAAVGRCHLNHRLTITANTTQQLSAGIHDVLSRVGTGIPLQEIDSAGVNVGVAHHRPQSVVFLFSGQGCQYSGMAHQLYDSFPVFREQILLCQQKLLAYCEYPITELMWGDATHLLNETQYTQITLFAVEYGLARLWQSLGVMPSYVIGHSVGEIAAACIAGVLALDDALFLVYERGRLMHSLPRDGGMAVVALGADAMGELLGEYGDEVAIASINTRDQVVISGRRDSVGRVLAQLDTLGIEHKGFLDISIGSHSPLMNPILDAFRQSAAGLSYHAPTVQMISTVTGKPEAEALMCPQYWVDNISQPVDFVSAMAALDAGQDVVFVEIGPKAMLLHLARECLDGAGMIAAQDFKGVASLRLSVHDDQQMMDAVGYLHVNGQMIDFKKLAWGHGSNHPRITLPAYPFQGVSHWLKPVARRKQVHGSRSSENRLLGDRVHVAGLNEPVIIHEALLDPQNLGYLDHHKVFEKTVLPGACYVDMALSALAGEIPGSDAAIENLSIQSALVLDAGTTLQTVLTGGNGGRYRFAIYSAPTKDLDPDAAWTCHATGDLMGQATGSRRPPQDVEAGIARFLASAQPVTVDSLYQRFDQVGMNYGPGFRSIEQAFVVLENSAAADLAWQSLALIALPDSARKSSADDQYRVHPMLLDGCFQSLASLFVDIDADSAYVPIEVARMQVFESLPGKVWCHGVLKTDPGTLAQAQKVVLDLDVFDEQGRHLIAISGLVGARINRQEFLYAVAPWKHHLYSVEWIEAASGNGGARRTIHGRCLICTDDPALADCLFRGLGVDQAKALQVGRDRFEVTNRADWCRYFGELTAEGGGTLSDIYFMWPLGVADRTAASGQTLTQLEQWLCGSLLALLQGLVDAQLQLLPSLTIVTRNAFTLPVDVSTDGLAGLVQSMLWGMGRTLALEFPSLSVRCVDLESAAADDHRQVVARIVGASDEPQELFRGTRRYVLRMVPGLRAQENRRLPTPVITDGNCYLITGGLGALGMAVAERLIRMGARELVLVGRNAAEETAAERIRDWQSKGIAVHVESLDIADADRVAQLIARIGALGRPLAGIVHAAGILDDGLITTMSWRQFAGTLAAKASGAWNLHQASQGLALDFFIMFSSIASVTGAPGQINYAAANCFMDALAHHRHARGLCATTINWGPWSQVGLAEERLDKNESRFRAMGLSRISVADNIDILEHLIRQPVTQVMVADVAWSRYLKTIPSQGVVKLYERLDKRAALRQLEPSGKLLDELLQLPVAQRAAHLVQAMKALLCNVLGLPAPDQLNDQQSLLELGMDSLMVVDLKNRLERGLRCLLRPSMLMDHPTIDALSRYLCDDVLGLTSEPGVRASGRDADTAPEQPAEAVFRNMREHAIQKDGRVIQVCGWGDEAAPLVVLVHGMLDQGPIWEPVAEGIAGAGYHVVTFDLRGHGLSSHNPAGVHTSVLDFLIDLQTVVEHTIRERRDFILVGHSIGSVVAANYAGLYPQRVSSLALIEPILPAPAAGVDWFSILANGRPADADMGPLARLKRDLEYAQNQQESLLLPDLDTAAEMLRFSHPRLTTARAVALAKRITRPTANGWMWTWDARLRNPNGIDFYVSRDQYRSILQTLDVRTLRVYGSHSALKDKELLFGMTQLLNRSECLEITGGHNVHSDNPAALIAAILDFNGHLSLRW